MIPKRIVPCLDMRDGKVVKGIRFEDIRDVGDPADMAVSYEKQGADEIMVLDISGNKELSLKVVSEISKKISIPLCFGGGIRTVRDAEDFINAGADRISIGSAAVSAPDLISECSEKFGKDRIIVAIDARKEENGWNVYVKGGKENTGMDAGEWAVRAEKLGAGEILLTSMDGDGAKTGYDIPLTSLVSDSVEIPVIASGGCGSVEHIYEVFDKTDASAALAASVFHYGEMKVSEAKEYLRNKGVTIR
jgi:cyclase